MHVTHRGRGYIAGGCSGQWTPAVGIHGVFCGTSYGTAMRDVEGVVRCRWPGPVSCQVVREGEVGEGGGEGEGERERSSGRLAREEGTTNHRPAQLAAGATERRAPPCPLQFAPTATSLHTSSLSNLSVISRRMSLRCRPSSQPKRVRMSPLLAAGAHNPSLEAGERPLGDDHDGCITTS